MTDSLLSPEHIRLSSSPRPENPISSSTPKISSTSDDSVVPLMTNNILSPPRNHSPFSRTHNRSRSLASPLPQPMTRAHSSPGLDSRGRYIYPPYFGRPTSPMDRSVRRNSPLRTSDDTKTLGLGSLSISETISEYAELEISPLPSPGLNSIDPELRIASSPLPPPMHNTFPRPPRRQPTSPLQTNFASVTSNPISSPTSAHSSPGMLATKFNEPFPGFSVSSASSMPSTPTSLRSRSPSISSLETIPDIPDAEAAAVEADHIAQLKADADIADADSLRRRSNDSSPSSSLRGYGARADKRKRWSVCGGERRQDLDLETIWEDGS